LGGRRTVETIQVGSGVAANIQLDMGGMWAWVDANGVPAQSAQAFNPSAAPDFLLSLPGLAAARLRVQQPTLAGDIALKRVDVISYPSNLVLRLGELGPFWVRTGDLRTAVSTPDFASILGHSWR